MLRILEICLYDASHLFSCYRYRGINASALLLMDPRPDRGETASLTVRLAHKRVAGESVLRISQYVLTFICNLLLTNVTCNIERGVNHISVYSR